MDHIGYYAWRVLQNARKAAIARRNAEGAEKRGEGFKVKAKPATHPKKNSIMSSITATRQHPAPTVAGESAGLERTRKKRPASSEN